MNASDVIKDSLIAGKEVAGAIFSSDRKYRYVLWRVIDSNKPMLMFVGLNPSKASENVNDNTIKKLIKITRNNGYGGFYMCNLFAWISTKPEVLLNKPEIIGQDNNNVLRYYYQVAEKTIFCWGAFKEAHKSGRAVDVIRILDGHKNHCLRKTKNGYPWHPLYCLDTQKIIPW